MEYVFNSHVFAFSLLHFVESFLIEHTKRYRDTRCLGNVCIGDIPDMQLISNETDFCSIPSNDDEAFES